MPNNSISIKQETYLTEDPREKPSTIKRWTIEQLRNAMVAPESVNAFYAQKSEGWIFIGTNLDKIHDDELWRPCRTCKYPNGKHIHIYASNYGRIKISGDKKACELLDTADKSGPINQEKFKKILAENKSVGWLVARRVGYERGIGEFVYNLVADAWLPPRHLGDQVHHITNDGYDNRPKNLILLSAMEHYMVHNAGPGKTTDYKPED